MTTPTFTPTPDAPSRQNPATFSARSDTFLAYIVTFRNELVDLVAWVTAQVSAIAANALTAQNAAATATSAAGAAVAASGATVWVSGASYTANDDAAISPLNQLTYRAKLTHSGVMTDPSLDPTNWTRVGVDADDLLEQSIAMTIALQGR